MKKLYVTKSLLPPYEEYIKAIKPLWESHWLTNMGVYHMELESKLKNYLQVPEVSLLVNGHTALELTLQAMDFPAGGEVITTPFTFISTTHAIIRNRLNPVFCDIKEDDGTIDETKIESLITDRTVAILAVHVYGHICNIEAINTIAKKYKLKIIYDAAHAFGEFHNGIGVGNFGDASIFSFHATKVYNTIEGGAVTFANHDLYEKFYNLKNFGILDEERIVEVGCNAKMNEFSAIMGICNLKYVDAEIKARKRIYMKYRELLSNVRGINFFQDKSNDSSNYSYCPVLIDKDEYGIDRDELYDRLKEQGINTRKYFYPLTSDQICYQGKFSGENTKVAIEVSKQVLALPMYSSLDDKSVQYIVDKIRTIKKI